jgi:hypothetical protein
LPVLRQARGELQSKDLNASRILNAKQLPQIFYGLHMVEGVAEYQDGPLAEPYRIMVGENTIKKMDVTFRGRPVYVQHVDEVNIEEIGTADENGEIREDGYVVRSFFNKADGKHWAEFLIVSDEGFRAIGRGWALSNAYIPKGEFGSGGLWHGVEYSKEVLDAEYEHLAIVPNPRYEESVIMTPEEFQRYNNEKEQELTRLANSLEKGDKPMKLNIFKKAKVENTKDVDFDSLCVTLPKSGKELTLSEVVTQLDAVHNMHGYANGDHLVKVGEDEMSVNDLVKKHMDMCNAAKEDAEKKENDDDMDDESMDNAEDEADADAEAALKKNEEDEAEKKEDKKMKNAKAEADKKEKAEKKAKGKEHFESLKNAHNIEEEEAVTIDLMEDQVARGKERYG